MNERAPAPTTEVPLASIERPLTDARPIARSRDSLSARDANRSYLCGMLGSALLFVGVFAPLIRAPIVGELNYFMNGSGDGVIVLVFALGSVVLCVLGHYRGLWFTGVAALGLPSFAFVNMQIAIAAMKSGMAKELEDNPFRGLAAVFTESVQLQWGWPVLMIGAMVTIAGAINAERFRYKRNRQLVAICGAGVVAATVAASGLLGWFLAGGLSLINRLNQ